MCSSLLNLQVLAILSAEFRKTLLPKQILCFTIEHSFTLESRTATGFVQDLFS